MFVPMMQIGVHSSIGSFVIAGTPTIADNACRLFAQNGVLKDPQNLVAAAQYARGFAGSLPDTISDKMTRFFSVAHERILDGVENPPASLGDAYESFRALPSKAGMARYFGLLGDMLDQAHRNRRA